MPVCIFTASTGKISVDEGEAVCEKYAAACIQLTGVTAQQWTINSQTRIISGIVKWRDTEMMVVGMESLCRVAATLHPVHATPACRSITCPTHRAAETRPNTGFVQYPADYDPRG